LGAWRASSSRRQRQRLQQMRRIAATGLLLAAVFAAPAAMADDTARRRAAVFWQQGYLLHVLGDYSAAAAKFRDSIAALPTAEGHTFLGWSLSHLGRIDQAIDECKKAIALDPDFGNPYNDIGVYLIELGRPDEAVPWLERAIKSKRYCCYQFPHFNLGRILLEKGRTPEAKRQFERALEHDPDYAPARLGLAAIADEWL
jgi:Tfp pilus assembly protein PilF